MIYKYKGEKMSALFRILEKRNGIISEVYDEQHISGDVYMAVLDYIDECDVIFDFIHNFQGNTGSYAQEISPELAEQALEVLEEGKLSASTLSEEWGYDIEDILYAIKVITEYFEKLRIQSEISALIFEIY